MKNKVFLENTLVFRLKTGISAFLGQKQLHKNANMRTKWTKTRTNSHEMTQNETFLGKTEQGKSTRGGFLG
jgi:hypothetical protein